MSNHTPGPWNVGRVFDADEGQTVYVNAPKTSQTLSDTVICELSDRDTDANALLIAAAPDLLDACIRARSIPWAHNVAITNDIEKLRSICLAFADWNNSILLPAIDKAKGTTKP